MKTFLTLVKTQLNLNFGISALKYRFTKEKKKRWEPILIGIAIIASIFPLILFYSLFMTGMFAVGKSFNQPEIVITMAFVLGQLFVLIFGIFFVMGAFYFSRDLDILVPLPLKPYEVLGSKFVAVMVNEYLTLVPILLPPVIIYGIGMRKEPLYWIKAVLLIVTSPVIPLIIGSLFIIVLMRFVNVRKSKDLFAIVGGFLGILIALGSNLFFRRIPENGGGEFIKNFMESQSGLIKVVGQKFPPGVWATFGLSRPGLEGLGYFLLFVGVSVLLFFVLLWLGNRVFYKGFLSGKEVARKRKTMTDEEMNRVYGKTASPVAAIFKREWKLLLRTPVYMLNGMMGAVIGPFIVVLMLFAPGQSRELEFIFNFLNNPDYVVPITLGGLGFILFTGGMNIVASTAVSREGRTFWIAKMIPVSPKQQITAKFLQSFSISALGVLVTSIVLAVFLKFFIIRVFVIAILGLIGATAQVALNLIIDVLHPKLEWNSPQEAMKQNMNGILGMLISLLVIAVPAGISVAMVLLGTFEWLVYVILAVLLSAIAIPSLIALFALAERRYKKLEV